MLTKEQIEERIKIHEAIIKRSSDQILVFLGLPTWRPDHASIEKIMHEIEFHKGRISAYTDILNPDPAIDLLVKVEARRSECKD